MIRSIGRTVAAASLLLCLLTVALWVRSYWHEDALWLQTNTNLGSTGRNVRYDLETWRGGIRATRTISAATDRFVRPEADWSHMPAELGGWSNFDHYGGRTWLGFGAVSHSYHGSGGTGGTPPEYELYLKAPIWALALTLALAPAVWLPWAWGRSRRARRQHLCRNCGYDLRASPDRCPECGVTIVGVNRGAPGPRLWRPLAAALGFLLVLGVAAAVAGSAYLRAKERAWTEFDRIDRATAAAYAALGYRVDDDAGAQALTAALRDGAAIPPRDAERMLLDAIENRRPATALVLASDPHTPVDVVGVRALAEAIQSGSDNSQYFDVAIRLVERGVDVNATDTDAAEKSPPLVLAANHCRRFDELTLPRILLARGANPNGRGPEPDGFTPLLTLAARVDQAANDVELAQLLIEHGADVNARAQGLTPLTWAQTSDEIVNKKPLIRLLESHGARN